MAHQFIDLSNDLIPGAEIVHVSREVQHLESGFETPEHLHEDLWQIEWIVSGYVEYTLPDTTRTVGPGEIHFIPPMIRHRHFSSDGFSFRDIKIMLPIQLPHLMPRVVTLTNEAPLLRLLADDLFLMRLPQGVTVDYLGTLLRLYYARSHPIASHLGQSMDSAISKAQQYALSNLRKSLTIDELSTVALLSRSQFCRRFKNVTGLAPAEWITNERMTYAEELLRYSDLPLSEIAGEIGYIDLPTFSKAFKRWSGHPPSAYRRAKQEEDSIPLVPSSR